MFSVYITVVLRHLRIKHVFRDFIAWWKSRRTFGRIWEHISENPRQSRGFLPAREFSQTLPRFSTGYGGTDNMSYFFYKIIIFIVNKKKDCLRSAYCKFSQLWDRQTTLLTPFSCFIALWKHTCKPIKTHIQSKLFHKHLSNYVPLECLRNALNNGTNKLLKIILVSEVNNVDLDWIVFLCGVPTNQHFSFWNSFLSLKR